MIRRLKPSTQFKRDLRLAEKRGTNLEKIKIIVGLLQNGQKLPLENRDHPLKGVWIPCRECHILPDVLLIYYDDGETLFLYRLGSHSDLFKA